MKEKKGGCEKNVQDISKITKTGVSSRFTLAFLKYSSTFKYMWKLLKYIESHRRLDINSIVKFNNSFKKNVDVLYCILLN